MPDEPEQIPDLVSQAAQDCIDWLYGTDGWLHRRVETVEFIDATTVRRRLSLDCSIPVRGTAGRLASVLVPLGWIRKAGPLVNLSAFDESGAVLPIVESASNKLVAHGMLTAYAIAAIAPVLGRVDIDQQFSQALLDIAGPDVERANDAFEWLFPNDEDTLEQFAARRTRVPRSSEMVIGADDEELRTMCEQVRDAYLLMADVPLTDTPRRVLKFSYDGSERVDHSLDLPERLGIRPAVKLVNASAPVAPLCPIHLELSCTDELVVVRGEIGTAAGGDFEPFSDAKIAAGRAHFYEPTGQIPEPVAARVLLRLPVAGLVLTAAVGSVSVSAMLWGGALLHHFGKHLDENADAAAAVLSLLGVLVAVVASSQVHPLTERIARGMLLSLYLVAGCALLAGATLIANFSGDTRERIWFALAVPVSLLTIASLIALTRSWRAER